MKNQPTGERARDVAFMTWLSPEEKTMLFKLAQRQGITMSSWVRKAIRETAVMQDLWVSPKQA